MTIPNDLERYIVLSLEKHLRDDAGVVADGVEVQLPGERAAADQTDEDWIEMHVLQFPRTPTRNGTWASGMVTWQASCFSRTGNARADADALRPWTLWGLVRAAFEGQSVTVAPYGNATLMASTPVIGCMTAREGEPTYLPEPSVGFQGVGGVPSQPSNLHAVAGTFRGTLVVV